MSKIHYFRTIVVLIFLFAIRTTQAAMPIAPFPENDIDRVHPASRFVEKNTIPQLRYQFMTDCEERWIAGLELLRREDLPSILRLIYAVKLGHSSAIGAIRDADSLTIVPFLMEEIAHGNLERIEGVRFSVRGASTDVVADIFRYNKHLPEGLKTRFYELLPARGMGGRPEASEALVDWWIHNGDAFLERKWENATWFTEEKKLKEKISRAALDRIKKQYNAGERKEYYRPLRNTPLPVNESFEAWSERIVHPERVDLTFVPIDFDDDYLAIPSPSKPPVKKLLQWKSLTDTQRKLNVQHTQWTLTMMETKPAPTVNPTPDSVKESKTSAPQNNKERGNYWFLAAISMILLAIGSYFLLRRGK